MSGGDRARPSPAARIMSPRWKQRLNRSRPRAPGLIGSRRQLDAGDQAEITQIDDMLGALEAVDRLLPVGRDIGGALEQAFFGVDVEGGQCRRDGQRMARIGVAVEQFDRLFGTGHEGVVNARPCNDATHRYGTRGDSPWQR